MEFDKKRLYYVLIPLIIVAVGLSIASYGLLSSESSSVFKVNTPSSVVDKLRSAEKQGGTIELTEADFNALLEIAIKDKTLPGDIKIDGIYSQIADSKLKLYIPATYKGIKLTISSEGDLLYSEGQAVFKPDYMKAGKLKLPMKFIAGRLNSLSIAGATITENGSIEIPKEVFPVNIKSMSLNGDKLVIELDKVSAVQQQTTQQNSTNKNTTSSSKTVLLKRAQGQLSGVYNSAKTSSEKAVIGQIQTVVAKMVANPSYSYAAEAQQVKAQYSRLSAEEQSDLKDAILMNMDTSTLREIKNTFGL